MNNDNIYPLLRMLIDKERGRVIVTAHRPDAQYLNELPDQVRHLYADYAAGIIDYQTALHGIERVADNLRLGLDDPGMYSQQAIDTSSEPVRRVLEGGAQAEV